MFVSLGDELGWDESNSLSFNLSVVLKPHTPGANSE